MVFQFEHMQVDHGASKFDVRPLDLRALKASLGRWQDGLADVGWNSLYWDNHDQPRVVSRFGDDGAFREASAAMLATVLHLHRGTPYVYQGEELAMTNAPLARVEDLRDLEALNHYAEAVAAGGDPRSVLAIIRPMARDNARTPMQWDGSAHADFTTGTPWIDVNPNHVEINAEAAVADPRSIFHHYRRLIALRHDEPVVALGSFSMLLPDHPSPLRVHPPARPRRAARGGELLARGRGRRDPRCRGLGRSGGADRHRWRARAGHRRARRGPDGRPLGFARPPTGAQRGLTSPPARKIGPRLF